MINQNHQGQYKQAAVNTAKDLSPGEIYALFEPRFGASFAEWFAHQYKRKSS